MPTPTHHVNWGRRSGRRLLTCVTALLLTATAGAGSLPAQADAEVTAAKAVSFTVNGAGYGHGWGMSQYGANGAAKKGLNWKQILGFYYPGTARTVQSKSATIKVWITADSDNNLRVLPARGLTVSDGSGHRAVLPTGAGYRAWQITRAGSGYRLSYLGTAGSWVTRKTALNTTTWSFSNAATIVKVWVKGGARRELRGTVALVKRGSGGRTVNRLSMESYVQGVVPAEMPTSWRTEAVRAQAVAARSYAARLQSVSRASGYDLCDTPSCQVYRGLASTSGGRRTVYETARGNAAVKATARTILTYRGAPALTQFASSNGGASAKGDFAYLAARPDHYDGVITSQSWHRTVSAASLARMWPSVGTVRQVTVMKRDGSGRWGGRVTSIKITGSKHTVTVSGSRFQSAFGLRSSLFAVSRS